MILNLELYLNNLLYSHPAALDPNERDADRVFDEDLGLMSLLAPVYDLDHDIDVVSRSQRKVLRTSVLKRKRKTKLQYTVWFTVQAIIFAYSYFRVFGLGAVIREWLILRFFWCCHYYK